MKLANLCLDEHMLPHDYSLLKISTAQNPAGKGNVLAVGGPQHMSGLTPLTALSGWLFPLMQTSAEISSFLRGLPNSSLKHHFTMYFLAYIVIVYI